jgi:hypothetical protein
MGTVTRQALQILKTMESNKKVNLHLPLSFWSEILMTIDRKVQTICENYGYGKVGMSVIIHKGKVIDVVFDDEIRVRGLVDKAISISIEKTETTAVVSK